MRTKRLLLSSGYKVLGTDSNYYNRAFWKIINDGQGGYLFENHETKRYLYSEGDEMPGDRGCEGGAAEAPLCVDSDASYMINVLFGGLFSKEMANTSLRVL